MYGGGSQCDKQTPEEPGLVDLECVLEGGWQPGAQSLDDGPEDGPERRRLGAEEQGLGRKAADDDVERQLGEELLRRGGRLVSVYPTTASPVKKTKERTTGGHTCFPATGFRTGRKDGGFVLTAARPVARWGPEHCSTVSAIWSCRCRSSAPDMASSRSLVTATPDNLSAVVQGQDQDNLFPPTRAVRRKTADLSVGAA